MRHNGNAITRCKDKGSFLRNSNLQNSIKMDQMMLNINNQSFVHVPDPKLFDFHRYKSLCCRLDNSPWWFEPNHWTFDKMTKLLLTLIYMLENILQSCDESIHPSSMFKRLENFVAFYKNTKSTMSSSRQPRWSIWSHTEIRNTLKKTVCISVSLIRDPVILFTFIPLNSS